MVEGDNLLHILKQKEEHSTSSILSKKSLVSKAGRGRTG